MEVVGDVSEKRSVMGKVRGECSRAARGIMKREGNAPPRNSGGFALFRFTITTLILIASTKLWKEVITGTLLYLIILLRGEGEIDICGILLRGEGEIEEDAWRSVGLAACLQAFVAYLCSL